MLIRPYKKLAAQCSADPFVGNQSLVLSIKICGKNRQTLVAAKRYRAFYNERQHTMKNELSSLYTSRQKEFKKVEETFPEDDLAGSLLMSPNLDYYTSPNKHLIIGQETNGWSYHTDDIEKQMKTYEDFNVGIAYYASPFWNITRKVEIALDNQPHSCAWTNLKKFDLDAGQPYGEYETAISILNDILLSELKIIKPDFCLFYTGPSFDYRLRKIFQDIEFVEIPNFTVRQFAN